MEKRVTHLEQLPDRVDNLASQVSQLRSEMRAEFCAVRSEMAELGVTLRQELAAGLAAVRQEFRSELRTGLDGLATQMRVLHEDVIGRIARLQEGRPAPPTSRRRRR